MDQEQHKITSTVKRIKDLDFSQVVVINQLSISREIAEREYKSYKKAWPTLPEKDIWDKLNETVLKDCVFSKAMQQALKSYEVNITDEDIDYVSKNFRKYYPTFANSSDQMVRNFVKQTIIKDLIINDLAKYWKIQATDYEAKLTFERMYVASEGKRSVHGYIKDRETMNYVKGLIIRDKTVNRLISELKYKIDWESINKKNEEYKAKLKARSENNK